MSTAARRGHGATFADIADRPEEDRLEIINGEIVRKAAPDALHSNTQGSILELFRPPYQRGRGGPGGWWLLPEIDIELDIHEAYRPDVAGWRKERVPELPKDRPVRIRPDWVAEVLSESNAENDLGRKLFGYHAAGVPHYWILDPRRRMLTVYRYTRGGYVVVLVAERRQTVRAEPFDEVDLEIDLLFDGT